jgi:hypothetical protein
MKHSPTWWSAAAVLVLAASACAQDTDKETQSAKESPSPDVVVSADTYDPSLFENSADVTHRWYPLQPGTRLDYRGTSVEDGERLNHGVTIIVTDLTKVVDGVENVVVWERDYTEGELAETELALFAEDRDGNIWHMGEYPEEWEEGEFVKAPAWVHGIAGATAGVTIPGSPTEGTPDYAQGFAPPPISWQDRGQVLKTGERTCVPQDCYADVVVIAEFERSVPGAFQDKSYAPGVGVVRVGWRGKNDDTKEVLELVDFQTLTDQEMEEVHREALALEDRAYRISPDVWGTTPRSEARGG